MAAKVTPARKAPARRARPTVKSPSVEKVETFEALRARARETGLRLGRPDVGPFVIPGFDPPIEVHWPESLLDEDEVYETSASRQFNKMLRVLLGAADYRRVLERFDAFEDKRELVIGLSFKIIDHFNGVGASDVEGGTPAS